MVIDTVAIWVMSIPWKMLPKNLRDASGTNAIKSAHKREIITETATRENETNLGLNLFAIDITEDYNLKIYWWEVENIHNFMVGKEGAIY